MPTQAELHHRLEVSGFWRPFEHLDQLAEDIRQREARVRQRREAERFRDEYLRRLFKGAVSLRRQTIAFVDGQWAFKRKVPKAENPHERWRIEFDLWNEGWDFAQDKAQKRGTKR